MSEQKIYYTIFESPIGPLVLTSDGTYLIRLDTGRRSGAEALPPRGSVLNDDAEPFALAKRELTAYFAGELREFTVPLNPAGTEFQQRVWKELREIPFGQTITYGEQARRIGNSNASRAVGLANGKNPISIIVPCHRVIGSNGKLTGYAGGLERKDYLLSFEKTKSLVCV